MRNWLKAGIIVTICILFLSLGLVGFSYFYYNNTKVSNSQTQVEKPNEPEKPILPDNEQKPNITPPAEEDTNTPPQIDPNPDLPNIDEETQPPMEEEKPNNNKPPVEDNEQNNKPTPEPKPEAEVKPSQYSIISNFDKYKYIQHVTDYQTFFKNKQQLKFNEIRIKTNTFSYIQNAIVKSMKLNLSTNILRINVYYQLDRNSFNKLKLLINWSIKSNNSSILEKKYYDNIHINLKKVQ